MDDIYVDTAGNRLSRKEVVQRAWDNAWDSMSFKELLEFYFENMNDVELMQWATNEEGRFTVEETDGDKDYQRSGH